MTFLVVLVLVLLLVVISVWINAVVLSLVLQVGVTSVNYKLNLIIFLLKKVALNPPVVIASMNLEAGLFVVIA